MEHRRGPSMPIPHLETSSLPNGELSVPCLPPILWYRLQEAELPKTGCPFYRPYFALGQLRHPDIHWPAQSCRRSSPSLSVTLRFALCICMPSCNAVLLPTDRSRSHHKVCECQEKAAAEVRQVGWGNGRMPVFLGVCYRQVSNRVLGYLSWKEHSSKSWPPSWRSRVQGDAHGL